jgi:hypothetical protein
VRVEINNKQNQGCTYKLEYSPYPSGGAGSGSKISVNIISGKIFKNENMRENGKRADNRKIEVKIVE